MKSIIKSYVEKNLENFAFFFGYIRYKIFFVIGISLFVGVLDGFGLAMFLPLLQVADSSSGGVDSTNMGNLSFLVDWLSYFGIVLNIPVALSIIVFFFAVKGAFAFFNGYYKIAVNHFFVRKIRVEGLDKLGNLKYKYFLVSDAGRIQNSLTSEVDRVGRSYSSYFMSLQNGILVLTYMVFAFLIDWKFAVLVSIGGFLSNLIFKRIYKRTEKSSKNLTFGGNQLQGLMLQSVGNYKYLKSSGKIDFYLQMVKKRAMDVELSTNKIAKYGNILFATREPIIIMVVCIVIYIQIVHLNTPLEGILVSLLFFYRALTALMQAQASWNSFLEVSGSLENMTKFLSDLENNQERRDGEIFEGLKDGIEFQKVGLAYGNKNVLSDINFQIPKSSTIAFVGESGSGKTSIVNLLSGLLAPDKGRIKVDGKDLNKVNISSYQARIGYISQDSVIFNDTVFNNVTFWDTPSPENLAKFWKACEQAAIKEFIGLLEAGENEILGNNGINLSGGQKQRISIARELYKDIDILILDEATSALDSETEKEIQENIESLRGFYTIVIIAHRLSTIKNADNIVFLQKGNKIAEGSFYELVDKVPNFKSMVVLQGV